MSERDIVKRLCVLRERDACGSSPWLTCNDAANMITDLAAQISTLQAAFQGAEGDRDAMAARLAEGEKILLDTAAHLAAAISLLKASPKTGAPSNKMFDQMVEDYERALRTARSFLTPTGEGK